MHEITHVPGPSLPGLLMGTQSTTATGLVRLTIQGNRLFDNPRRPEVRVNGYPVAVDYGENPIRVPSGRAAIEVECRLLRRYGRASVEVEVPAGGDVPLFYAAPHHEFTAGSIGAEPQRRRGSRAALALALVALAQMVVQLTLMLR